MPCHHISSQPPYPKITGSLDKQGNAFPAPKINYIFSKEKARVCFGLCAQVVGLGWGDYYGPVDHWAPATEAETMFNLCKTIWPMG